MINLANYPLTLVFAVSVVVILAACETGRRWGVNVFGRSSGNVSTLEGALLGLLSLLIGFTFAMALTRFDARRDAMLEDANAIGTTALRARLLPQPYSSATLKLLLEYTQLRLKVSQPNVSASLFAAVLARSNEIQEALWLQAKMAARDDDSMVPTGIFIQSLNQLIDVHQKRLTAFHNRVPLVVLWSLYGLTVVASLFTGYACALETRRSPLAVYLVAVVVAGVILLIQDLDRPAGGFITINQQPMINVTAALKSYAD